MAHPLTDLIGRMTTALDSREQALLGSLQARFDAWKKAPALADDGCGRELRPSRPIVVKVGVDDELVAELQAPVGLEVHAITAHCTDERGLEAFRLGWRSTQDKERTEFWEPGDDQTTHPLASQVVVSRLDDLRDAVVRPLAGRQLAKDDRLYFLLQNETGALPYTVEIVVWAWVQVAR